MKHLIIFAIVCLCGCVDNSRQDTNFERSSVTYYDDRTEYAENAKKSVSINGRTSIVNAN